MFDDSIGEEYVDSFQVQYVEKIETEWLDKLLENFLFTVEICRELCDL